jgi:gas vesicle protein
MNEQDYSEYLYDDSGSDAIKWVSVGFGIGLVVGGIVGLLMAPKSGTETREQLKNYAGDLSDKTKDLASNLQERGKQVASDVSEKVSHGAVEIKDKARHAAEVAQDAFKAGKEAVQKVATVLRDGEGADNGSPFSTSESGYV